MFFTSFKLYKGYQIAQRITDFLSRCFKDRLIPKGLKVELEPTIGNFDREFIDNWFSKLEDYSFDLMKDIIKFCDKTIAETKPTIRNIETKLKASMEREEFVEIDKTIKEKEEATKRLLQQKNSRNLTT